MFLKAQRFTTPSSNDKFSIKLVLITVGKLSVLLSSLPRVELFTNTLLNIVSADLPRRVEVTFVISIGRCVEDCFVVDICFPGVFHHHYTIQIIVTDWRFCPVYRTHWTHGDASPSHGRKWDGPVTVCLPGVRSCREGSLQGRRRPFHWTNGNGLEYDSKQKNTDSWARRASTARFCSVDVTIIILNILYTFTYDVEQADSTRQ